MEGHNEYTNADTISIDTLALEEMVLEERKQEITQLNCLNQKVCYLHSDILYYRNTKTKFGKSCYEAWKILLKKLGGTPNAWRHLGHSLGIAQDDLDYIMNSVKEDPADMVLKVFRQNEKATMDKIINSLVDMKRYDILKALEEPLINIAQYFNRDDSGYQSNSKCTGQREIITLRNLSNDLPPALNINIVSRKDKNPKQPALQPSLKEVPVPAVNEGPILFLTYTADGLPTALNIQEYVVTWTDIQGVKVITLNGKKDEIYQNPEKFIREYFEKANFIVPIITPGYLEEIRSNNVNIPNTSSNLDHKYANFIYKLIVNHYIHATGCVNKKVRSVLPQNANVDLFKKISMYPDLMPWTYETHFDEQFQAFLKLQSLTTASI